MGDWTEYAHIFANNAPGQLGSVTSVRFDPYSELLWAGSASGQITSHYGADLQRYTSYPAHGTVSRPAPTKALYLDERHIYSVGETGLHCASRKGLARWGVLAK